MAGGGAGVYAVAALLICVAGLVAALCFPSHRRVALLAGLCGAPLGLADAVFVPQYWDPLHLFGAAFSVEGMLFSFGNGTLVWLAAALPFSHRTFVRFEWRRMARRYLACISLGGALLLLLWHGGPGLPALPVMDAALFTLAMAGATLVVLRPDVWPFAVSGALGFTAIYSLQLFTIGWVFPDAPLLWATEIRAGATVLDFPVEELVWALAYGAVCPLAVAYGCDVSLRPLQRAEGRRL